MRTWIGPSRDSLSLVGDHAVVLGASMAGLLAARVLSDFYAQVTVVDRDVPSDQPRARRGVPQGRHAHALLPRGAKVLDELFPGFLADLDVAGVPVVRDFGQLRFSVNGHLLSQRGEPGDPAYQPSRPYLESRVRARVQALPNVTMRDGYDVVGLDVDPSGTRVTGTRVVRRGEATDEQLLKRHGRGVDGSARRTS